MGFWFDSGIHHITGVSYAAESEGFEPSIPAEGVVSSKTEEGKTTYVIQKSAVTDLTEKVGITHEEFLQFAANVYNETFQMESKEKFKVASAMMNRKLNSDRYDDRSYKYMTDNLMFNGDSHEKKMSEIERRPGNKEDYKNHKFTYQDVSAEHYRTFFSTKPSARTKDMKEAIRASLSMLENPVDMVDGANSWVGDGVKHTFSYNKKL